MAHPSIIAALKAGILEPCVILDDEGRDLRGYRPTASARGYFGSEQSEMVNTKTRHALAGDRRPPTASSTQSKRVAT